MDSNTLKKQLKDILKRTEKEQEKLFERRAETKLYNSKTISIANEYDLLNEIINAYQQVITVIKLIIKE